MKCAECGRENQADARFCCYCAVPLVKESVVSDTGSALRKIYNDFGYEKVFEDHRYITSALGDFVPDSEMISNSIEMAYRAGLGKVYEAQIRKGGKPNEAFYKHVKEVITEDAGLSEKRANQIIEYFDEMLGWNIQDIPDSTSTSESVVKVETNEVSVKSVEITEPTFVNAPKSEAMASEPASNESVMPEPEDEVLAALADEGINPFKSVYFATPAPEHVETISEEEPIRSIPQDQALAELQPEEGFVDADPFKKTESPFKTIEEKNSKKSADRLERKHQAEGKGAVKLGPAAIIALIIVTCIAFGIVWAIVIKPSQMQESSSVIQESSSEIQESSKQQEQNVSLSNATIGSSVFFGSYEQDNISSNGKEDIEWIVLAREDNRILVISRYALDCQKYNAEYTNVTWETCSLRNWLNGTFLNTAFSDEERGKIPTVTVSADKNPSYSTNLGKATTDQVFLLSITEAAKYFSSDSARECKGTAYCYSKGGYRAENGNCWWWLRSPGSSSDYAAFVNSGGYVNYFGCNVNYDLSAVRPALWINLDPNSTNNNEPQESSEKTEESGKQQETIVSLSKAEIGSHVFFGSYEQDDNYSNGKEDIEWIVLAREDNRILVISRYALDCQPYKTKNSNVTWETCSLRYWLNGTFLNTAFSSEERGKIPLVTVSSDKNPGYSTNPGKASMDQVFLLSITEANKYFSSDSARSCKRTAYCYAIGAYKYSNSASWWLRSPGCDSKHAARVLVDGSVDDYGSSVDGDGIAVRPAMWINVGS